MTEVFFEPVDFGKLLDDLEARGWSGYAVAKALGRSWDTVQGWRKHQPRHQDGEALKALHARECRTLGPS